MIAKTNYDKENDILSVRWGDDATEYSEELETKEGHEFVIDYDKRGRIIGIEIFYWNGKNDIL